MRKEASSGSESESSFSVVVLCIGTVDEVDGEGGVGVTVEAKGVVSTVGLADDISLVEDVVVSGPEVDVGWGEDNVDVEAVEVVRVVGAPDAVLVGVVGA